MGSFPALGGASHRAKHCLVPHRRGSAILGAAALWAWIEKWIATDLPWVIKAASGALLLGFALLIVSILRERSYLHRRDPYSKEVLR